jgi:hypothetical protein
MKSVEAIKRKIKALLVDVVRNAVAPDFYAVEGRLDSVLSRLSAHISSVPVTNSAEIQCSIKNQYAMLKIMGGAHGVPRLNDVGFRVYSQFEEDGLLLYVFSMIGEGSKRVVEICAGDGKECMAANLLINHGWQGLLFDGDDVNVQFGRDFYANHPATFIAPPVFMQAWITRENVNQLILDNGYSGEVDLLSIDIDGNGYWILETIDVINPRVIICEAHDIIPGDLALSMPYDPSFNYMDLPIEKRDFRNASLLAFKQICSKKGYRLIGSHRYGFNVLFMRNDTGIEYFPEVSIQSIHDNPWTRYGQQQRWPKVKDMPWIRV